jgi:hypothetical protein
MVVKTTMESMSAFVGTVQHNMRNMNKHERMNRMQCNVLVPAIVHENAFAFIAPITVTEKIRTCSVNLRSLA